MRSVSPEAKCARTVGRISHRVFAVAVLSVLLSGLSTGSAAEEESVFAFAKKTLAQGQTQKSKMGGFGIVTHAIQETPRIGVVVAGFDLGLGKAGNEQILSIRALYRHESGEFYGEFFGRRTERLQGKFKVKSQVERSLNVTAKQGYAVGAINVSSSLTVEGMSVRFMRIRGNRLDPTDAYTTEWYGSRNSSRETTLDSQGYPVIGIFGSVNNANNDHLNALGLIHISPSAYPAPAQPPPTPKPEPPPVASKPVEPPIKAPPVEVPAVTEPPPGPPVPTPAPSFTETKTSDNSMIWLVLAAIFAVVTLGVAGVMYLQQKRAPALAGQSATAAAEQPVIRSGGLAAPPDEQLSADEEPARAAAPAAAAPTAALRKTPAVSTPIPDVPLPSSERVGFGLRLGGFAIDLVAAWLLGIIIGALLGSLLGATAGKKIGSELAGAAQNAGRPGFQPDAMQRQQVQNTGTAAGIFGGVAGAIIGASIGVTVMQLILMFVEGMTGLSLGKWLLKMRVRGENGLVALPGPLMTRAAVKFSPTWLSVLSFLLVFVPGLGWGNGLSSAISILSWLAMLAILIGCFLVLMEKRQALHDMAAKTAVYPVLSPAQQLAAQHLLEPAEKPTGVRRPSTMEDGIQERPRYQQLPDAPPARQSRGEGYGARDHESAKPPAEHKHEDAEPEMY